MFGFDGVLGFFKRIDKKDLKRYVAMYVACFGLFVGLIVYRYVNQISHYQIQIKQLNRARKDLQSILTDYNQVKQQKDQVDKILKKDKNFYLQKFFQDLIKELKINQKAVTSLVSQKLQNGYIEESLQIRFSAITMQQLCQFLEKLETNQRVYAKKLDISSKGVQSRSISVSFAIATLKPEEETSNKR